MSPSPIFRRALLSLLPERFISPALLPLALAVLFSLGGGLLILSQAHFLSQVIARVFLGGMGLDGVAPQLGWLAAIILLRALLTMGGETAARTAALQVKSAVRGALTRSVLASAPARPGEERTGELVNILVEGVEALDAYFSECLPQLALAALLPLLLLAAVFPIDRLTGLVFLLTAPLIPIFMVLIGNLSESLTRRQWRVLGLLSAHFLDALQGLTTLKQLGRSQDQVRAVDRVSQEYRRTTLEVLKISFLSAFALELVATLSVAVIAVEISLRLLSGQLVFEQALFLLVLAPDFYLPLRSLGARFHAGTAGIAAARRIGEVLALPFPPEPAQPATVPSPPFTIRFEAVSYTYPGAAAPALDGASFDICSGEQTALVGESGAGKTTLLRLLLGFLRPDSGRIWINGVPLEAVSPAEWRRQVAWVPQDPYIFSGTIESNLRLAKPEASPAEIASALEQAALGEGTWAFPQREFTATGEQGARLSGGERQRLGIARALLKDCPLVLLDEPAAHLDPELADALAQAASSLARGRTVLTVAHRLETTAQADRVLVLERGRIVQAGAPADLLRAGGPFRRLAAAGEIDPE